MLSGARCGSRGLCGRVLGRSRRRCSGDVRLDLETRVQRLRPGSPRRLRVDGKGRQRKVDGRDDALERADGGADRADLVVAAARAQAILVRLVLIAGHGRKGLYVGDLEADAARGGGDVLEQRRNLVARRHQLAHDREVLCVLVGLRLELGGLALRKLGLGALVDHLERVETGLTGVELRLLRSPDVHVEDARGRESHEADEREDLIASVGREECHGYFTDTASGTRLTIDGSGRVYSMSSWNCVTSLPLSLERSDFASCTCSRNGELSSCFMKRVSAWMSTVLPTTRSRIVSRMTTVPSGLRFFLLPESLAAAGARVWMAVCA